MEKIKLDLVPSGKMPSLHASQYDDGREHGIDLFENGVAYKLDGTETLTINERKGDDCICSLDIENTFTGSNHIVFASTEQMCAVWGNNICELVIKRGSVTLGTLNFILEIEPSPTEGGIESESEISNLERQITEITEEVIGDDYYTAEETDEAIATAIEGKADKTYVDTKLDKKADKTDTYTKTQVDNALNNKMDKANPTGTGSFSLNRKADSTIGTRSFAEGYNNTASGNASHAEGRNTTASGNYSHSEGYQTTASESDSHAEGYQTTASGFYSHAEGYQAIASGSTSHAEGNKSEASGTNSHAEGSLTIANHKAQHVFGEFNVADDSTASELNRGNYVEIVGNGTSSNARSNARTLDWQGNETLAGDLTFNGNKSLTSEISRLDGRIDNLPAPMIFKGTLGVGGTIQSLPTASASNEGFTYKVITDGTYAGQTAKVGDVFTSNGSAWVLIPSGDEDTDTWRAIKVNGVEKLGNGISSGSLDVVDTDNIEAEFDSDGNKLKIKTKNIYTQSEVNALIANAVDSVLPTDSVSKSAIANFETDLAKPIELKAYIEATQASGTPTPSSPKAISGWSAISVVQTGINIWNGVTELGSFDTTTGEKVANNNLLRSVDPIPVKPNATYMRLIDTSLGFRVFYYDKNMNFLSTEVSQYTQLAITIPSDCYYMNIAYQKAIASVSINYPSSDTEYHAYNPNGNTEVINLGGTYYGGHFTQDKDGHRQFEVTHIAFDDWANKNVKLYGINTHGIANFYLDHFSQLTKANVGICNLLTKQTSLYSDTTEEGFLVNPSTQYIRLLSTRASTVDEFKTWATNNDLLIINELVTPFTVTLPDGEPINALIGTNNLFADSGDMECSFKCGVAMYVDNHSSSGNRSLAKSGGGEEEPDEGEDTGKAKLDEPKEEIKTIGDTKKLGGE